MMACLERIWEDVLILYNYVNNSHSIMMILLSSSHTDLPRTKEAELTAYFWVLGYLCTCVVALFLLLFYSHFILCMQFHSHVIFIHFKEISIQSVIHNNSVFHFF